MKLQAGIILNSHMCSQNKFSMCQNGLKLITDYGKRVLMSLYMSFDLSYEMFDLIGTFEVYWDMLTFIMKLKCPNQIELFI